MKGKRAAMKKKGSAAPEGRDCGMVTSGGVAVPLKGVAMDVRVRGAAVLTTVSQRFRNDEDAPIEALYSFPLEENSSVCGFEVEIGGRRIRGRVEEREKAFEKYDEAMQKGDSAFLLDQNRPDIFSVSVGRLLPGEEAVVRISHAGRTERFDKGLRLRIPTTISPRYIPPEKAVEMDPAELDAILPPTVIGGVPYGLSMSVDIEAGSAITAISCPSYPITVSMHGMKAQVGLAVREPQLDQDFVLDIELAEPGRAGVTACRDGESVAMMLRFRPVLAESAKEPRDVVFIVDRSGSMAGESFEEARAALMLCLRSLEEGDRFNVVGFGSTMDMMFTAPVAYDQKNLDITTALAGKWIADLGGTEILAPLKAVLEKAERGRKLDVLLLTDGEVGNEREVIELAGKHRKNARIFSFGIGRGASGTLVRGVARASGGMAEFIFPGERTEPKVIRQMARLSAPYAADTKLDWGGLSPSVAVPAELPAFCTGDEVDILCRVPSVRDALVRIRAADGSVIAECAVDGSMPVSDDRTIPLLLARELIASIEQGAASGGSEQSSRRRKGDEARILSTALEYGLVSSQTSYVAVEEREGDEKGGAVNLRRVPVALTRGYGGMQFCLPCAAPQGALLMAGAAIGGAKKAGRLFSRSRKQAAFDSGPDVHHIVGEAGPGYGPGAPDRFMQLVGLQLANGSWRLSKELVELAGMSDPEALKAEAPERLREDGALATLVALFLLRSDFADRSDEWALIAEKALKWLAGRGIPKPPDPSAGVGLAGWLKSL